jgi:DNA-binding transcriptional regulator YdaS (Cro superfamily)
MVTLSDYLARHDGKLRPQGDACQRVAQAANCAPGTLYLIALGHRKPGPTLAARITRATDGEVSPESLRPDIFGNTNH